MKKQPLPLKEAMENYIASYQPQSPKFQIARFLVEGNLTREGANELCNQSGVKYISDLKLDTLNIILYYIRSCLKDWYLLEEELENIRTMKLLFRVEEGDFIRFYKSDVEEIISVQFQLFIADTEVTEMESIMQSDLQKIFDLSYDQYLNITTPLVHELVDECLGTAPSMGLEYDVEDMRVVDLLFALDTFYQLTPDQRRVLDHDFDFEMPSRTIPQSVKDAVWRRDEGKCAQCGSQEFLEYDHVVPFSKGGANTYRNIQLLCQDCNRSKGANV